MKAKAKAKANAKDKQWQSVAEADIGARQVLALPILLGTQQQRL